MKTKNTIFLCAFLLAFAWTCCARGENWHVKEFSSNGRSAVVVMHIPVPVGNNAASPPKSWQDAVAEYIKPYNEETGQYGTWYSQLQGIDAGELGSLQAGALYEVVAHVNFQAQDTNLQKRNKIDSLYNSTVTSEQSKLQSILNFWGYARNVQ